MSQQIELTPTLPSSLTLQRIAWQLLLLSVMAMVAIFAIGNTSRLAKSDASLHANAQREPQSPDPMVSFTEIVLPAAPMPLLSSGYLGIAPSMHLIRLSGTRPLSNIDQLEHPSRRRYGRFDLGLGVVYMVPLALLFICFILYGQIVSSGAIERLMAGKLSLFDLVVEKMALPLSGWFGVCFLVLLSALYTNGLRLDSNQSFTRVLLWSSAVFFYSLLWLLLLGYLILRAKDFSGAVLRYAGVFVVACCLLPGLSQSVAQALAPSQSRLTLILERKAANLEGVEQRKSKIDAYLQKKQLPAMDWSVPMPPQRLSGLSALVAEEALEPTVAAFEAMQIRYGMVADALTWLSPASLTQMAMDDLAGTGWNRYQRFQDQSVAFYNQWRTYMLPRLLRNQPLDYEALRGAPRFQFVEEADGAVLLRNSIRLLVLLVACGVLVWLLMAEVKAIVPKKANAAR
jgi:ABC-2 type transport system permease protein